MRRFINGARRRRRRQGIGLRAQRFELRLQIALRWKIDDDAAAALLDGVERLSQVAATIERGRREHVGDHRAAVHTT